MRVFPDKNLTVRERTRDSERKRERADGWVDGWMGDGEYIPVFPRVYPAEVPRRSAPRGYNARKFPTTASAIVSSSDFVPVRRDNYFGPVWVFRYVPLRRYRADCGMNFRRWISAKTLHPSGSAILDSRFPIFSLRDLPFVKFTFAKRSIENDKIKRGETKKIYQRGEGKRKSKRILYLVSITRDLSS